MCHGFLVWKTYLTWPSLLTYLNTVGMPTKTTHCSNSGGGERQRLHPRANLNLWLGNYFYRDLICFFLQSLTSSKKAEATRSADHVIIDDIKFCNLNGRILQPIKESVNHICGQGKWCWTKEITSKEISEEASNQTSPYPGRVSGRAQEACWKSTHPTHTKENSYKHYEGKYRHS